MEMCERRKHYFTGLFKKREEKITAITEIIEKKRVRMFEKKTDQSITR